MNITNTLLTLSAAAVLVATSAFAGDLKKDIVGKWADADGVENIEHKADMPISGIRAAMWRGILAGM